MRAWRAIATYDEREASVRTWLHRIATNACLTALDSHTRRAMPSGLGGPAEDALTVPLNRRPEVPWPQPIPDALPPAEPAAVVSARETVRLASDGYHGRYVFHCHNLEHEDTRTRGHDDDGQLAGGVKLGREPPGASATMVPWGEPSPRS